MASIHLYKEHAPTDTSVPNQFIDLYMPQANGEFVKVYLYLLRCLSDSRCDCSITTIADTFNHTENDVLRALNYWERENLLQLEYDETQQLVGIRLMGFPGKNDDSVSIKADTSNTQLIYDTIHTVTNTDSASPDSYPLVSSQEALNTGTLSGNIPVSSVTSNIPNHGVSAIPSPLPDADTHLQKPIPPQREYSLDEIKSFRMNPDITELFFITETYLKHPLTSTDTNTILYWYDVLDFSAELIEYLIEYCISKGHSSIRYMDKVAIAWKEGGITTVLQAKEEAAIHSQVYYGVIKALGITGRNLVDSEQQFIQKWTREYQFDLELIQAACGRTISAIHQPSFEYTDSILASWYQKGVKKLEDTKILDEEFEKKRKNNASTEAASSTNQQQATTAKRNKFANFNQREYDYDQLEKMLLNTSVE